MIDWTQSLANKSPEEILNTIYEVTEDITKQFVPLRQDKKKKKNKHTRLKENLHRKKRRLNKQILKAKTQNKKQRLFNKLITVEAELHKLYRQTKTYEEAKAVNSINKKHLVLFQLYQKEKQNQIKDWATSQQDHWGDDNW